MSKVNNKTFKALLAKCLKSRLEKMGNDMKTRFNYKTHTNSFRYNGKYGKIDFSNFYCFKEIELKEILEYDIHNIDSLVERVAHSVIIELQSNLDKDASLKMIETNTEIEFPRDLSIKEFHEIRRVARRNVRGSSWHMIVPEETWKYLERHFHPSEFFGHSGFFGASLKIEWAGFTVTKAQHLENNRAYVWDKQAIGMSTSSRFITQSGTSPAHNFSTFAGGLFFAGSTVIDPGGVLEVKFKQRGTARIEPEEASEYRKSLAEAERLSEEYKYITPTKPMTIDPNVPFRPVNIRREK